MDKINLHFTGDFHAITSAHNMISALLDNYLYQNRDNGFGLKEVLWKRVLDVNDRSLRYVVTGLGPKTNGIPMSELERVELAPDEFEALRLVDLQGMLQQDAAVVMGVSRQTLANLVKAARCKVVDCLAHGKALMMHHSD
jgi:formyltetrahydrofolate synthetase